MNTFLTIGNDANEEDNRFVKEFEAQLEIAEPLFTCAALQRLRSITFLGILSPRFSSIVRSPLYAYREGETHKDDGSRFTHSLGVALAAMRLCRQLNLSSTTQRYALAWGLTHDLATWALSHTSEPAFALSTKTSSRELRAMMILGSSALPDSFCVKRHLEHMAIDPSVLAQLFSKGGSPLSSDLQVLKELIHSPISPDTLEGIWRSGRVFGVSVPHPIDIEKCVSRGLYDVFVPSRHSRKVLTFWKQKGHIYNRFINRPDVISWESSWTYCLYSVFGSMSVAESLLVTEDEAISRVLKNGFPESQAPDLLRYKHPLTYYIEPRRQRRLKSDESLADLKRILKKEELERGDK